MTQNQPEIRDMHKVEITIGYGMTETGPLSTRTLPDNLRERVTGLLEQETYAQLQKGA